MGVLVAVGVMVGVLVVVKVGGGWVGVEVAVGMIGVLVGLGTGATVKILAICGANHTPRPTRPASSAITSTPMATVAHPLLVACERVTLGRIAMDAGAARGLPSWRVVVP